MAVKALNFKMDEIDINEMKQDTFYKLTANVQEADKKESAEILDEIESLSDDDLSISSVEPVRAKGIYG